MTATRTDLDRELFDQILAVVPGGKPWLDRRRALRVLSRLDPAESTDVALGEHLEGSLADDDRLGAAAKAVELTLAFHEEMICEPAALAQADGPEARREAVRGHVAGCRSCRAEFAARVAVVLRHAGTIEIGDPRQPAAD